MPIFHDQPNSDLLDRIPLSARVVMDVGCGTAALAAAYRRRNPRARLLGIESHPEAAAVARPRLDELSEKDVESDPVPFEVSEGIDCIIYGDILEHLRDPWAVLRAHIEVLAPDGLVLICVPNMEHWSFAERLLRGTWNYEPSGLFDDTHLRWFSLETMRKGLTGLGLSPCDVHSRIFDQEHSARFAQALTPALSALGIDPATYARRAAPLQYVWRVRKSPQQRMLIAANMLKPVGGVSHLRILHPLRAMGTDPTVGTVLAPMTEPPSLDDNSPRIFILHRPVLTAEAGGATVRALLDRQWLVVTEFDDHPNYLQDMQEQNHVTFRGVHAVQTSTPALAAVLREHNPEVAIFPNAVLALPEIRNFVNVHSLTLFFGALNRERDWFPLMDAINAVVAKVGEQLRFCVVHDQEFYDALETQYKTFTPTCDYETYMELLGASEISFMPLTDNDFNRAKSDLKFIEAGACRVATLASDVVYGNSVEDGVTGLIFRNADELRDRLLRLVAMPELARDLGNAARAYVEAERMLAYQVAPRIAWYRSLWARREALTAALRARLDAVGEPAL